MSKNAVKILRIMNKCVFLHPDNAKNAIITTLTLTTFLVCLKNLL